MSKNLNKETKMKKVLIILFFSVSLNNFTVFC